MRMTRSSVVANDEPAVMPRLATRAAERTPPHGDAAGDAIGNKGEYEKPKGKVKRVSFDGQHVVGDALEGLDQINKGRRRGRGRKGSTGGTA